MDRQSSKARTTFSNIEMKETFQSWIYSLEPDESSMVLEKIHHLDAMDFKNVHHVGENIYELTIRNKAIYFIYFALDSAKASVLMIKGMKIELPPSQTQEQ
jgi:putative component of toxin-antitoxin plasmid stabilization module